jgi:hypothetical protein
MRDQPSQAKKAKEEQRLRAALRENLKRRKAQARARASAQTSDTPQAAHDSAGIERDKTNG